MDDLPDIHAINVTPFIDVMLVLLIVFMIAAPLSRVDTPVDLPRSNAAPNPAPDKPIILTLKADHRLLLNHQPLRLEDLVSALANSPKDRRLLLEADKTVAYGVLVEVMNLLHTAGYDKIGLVGLAP